MPRCVPDRLHSRLYRPSKPIGIPDNAACLRVCVCQQAKRTDAGLHVCPDFQEAKIIINALARLPGGISIRLMNMPEIVRCLPVGIAGSEYEVRRVPAD